MEDTINEKIVSDEQDARFRELNTKPENERTDEEKQELRELQINYGNTARGRIGELTKKNKMTDAELRRVRQEKEDLQRRLDEAEGKLKSSKPDDIIDDGGSDGKKPIKIEKFTADGREFYTEDTLNALVAAGKMSQKDAQKNYREGLKAELIEDQKLAVAKEQFKKNSAEAAREVLKEFPHFEERHPDYNPNDPLLVETVRLYNAGFRNNETGRGIALALEQAKRNLGITTSRRDKTDDLSLDDGGLPDDDRRDATVVTLSDLEKKQAEGMWCNQIKPGTTRNYTATEAHQIFKENKVAWLKKRKTARR